MDVIARLPDCAGQATDKNGRGSKMIQDSKVRMSRHLDTSSPKGVCSIPKSTTDFKEYHKKESIKMKIERGESEDWGIF